MDIKRALEIAEENFPQGPEFLAKSLSIKVESSPLSGCEGWCVRRGDITIVRVNSTSIPERQRFTLAHELAHIVLGSPPDISPLMDDECSGVDYGSHEEEIVNNFASELLLPQNRLSSLISSTPVTGKDIEKVSKAGNVSRVVVMRRIVRLSSELGLVDAFVVDLADNKLRWAFPRGSCFLKRARELLTLAKSTAPQDYVSSTDDRTTTVIVAETKWSSTLLFQAK